MTEIVWPRIVDADKKTISQVALELGLWCVEQGIQEHGGFNRGLHPDTYNRNVGLRVENGYPWCTSAWYTLYREAARQKNVPNPFPQTAKAVEVWNYYSRTAPQCLDSNPGVGAHYVLDHGRGWATQLVPGGRLLDNGHFGTCATLDGPMCATEVSANTNRAGSREGNAWAIHSGEPEVSHGGLLIGWVYPDRVFA